MLKKIGIEFDVVSNGQEAVDTLFTDLYAVVLMDCQMPVMDGFAATRLIRKLEAELGKESIPIVAMTANAMQGDKELCLEAGMDDYLPKPVSIDLLQEKIEKWMVWYVNRKNYWCRPI